MDSDSASSPTPQQLAHLQAKGKITAAEELAMESGDPQDSETVMTGVRARHAKGRLDVAVAAGAVSEDEAAGLLEQVKHGGHPPGLRSRINKLTRQSRSKIDPT